MTKRQEHIISKQFVEVNFNGSAASAMEFNLAIGQILNGSAKNRLLQEMDQIVAAPERIHIDNLTLELETFSIDTFQTDFEEKLADAFRQAIDKWKSRRWSRSTSSNLSSSGQVHHGWDVYCCFLQTGQLPWWSTYQSLKDLEVEVSRYVQLYSDWKTEFVQVLKKDTNICQRFIFQTSDELISKLTEKITGISTSLIRSLHQEWISLNIEFSISKRLSRNVFFKAITQSFLKNNNIVAFPLLLGNHLLSELSKVGLGPEQRILSVWIKKLAQRQDNNTPFATIIKQLFQNAPSTAKKKLRQVPGFPELKIAFESDLDSWTSVTHEKQEDHSDQDMLNGSTAVSTNSKESPAVDSQTNDLNRATDLGTDVDKDSSDQPVQNRLPASEVDPELEKDEDSVDKQIYGTQKELGSERKEDAKSDLTSKEIEEESSYVRQDRQSAPKTLEDPIYRETLDSPKQDSQISPALEASEGTENSEAPNSSEILENSKDSKASEVSEAREKAEAQRPTEQDPLAKGEKGRHNLDEGNDFSATSESKEEEAESLQRIAAESSSGESKEKHENPDGNHQLLDNEKHNSEEGNHDPNDYFNDADAVDVQKDTLQTESDHHVDPGLETEDYTRTQDISANGKGKVSPENENFGSEINSNFQSDDTPKETKRNDKHADHQKDLDQKAPKARESTQEQNPMESGFDDSAKVTNEQSEHLRDKRGAIDEQGNQKNTSSTKEDSNKEAINYLTKSNKSPGAPSPNKQLHEEYESEDDTFTNNRPEEGERGNESTDQNEALNDNLEINESDRITTIPNEVTSSPKAESADEYTATSDGGDNPRIRIKASGKRNPDQEGEQILPPESKSNKPSQLDSPEFDSNEKSVIQSKQTRARTDRIGTDKEEPTRRDGAEEIPVKQSNDKRLTPSRAEEDHHSADPKSSGEQNIGQRQRFPDFEDHPNEPSSQPTNDQLEDSTNRIGTKDHGPKIRITSSAKEGSPELRSREDSPESRSRKDTSNSGSRGKSPDKDPTITEPELGPADKGNLKTTKDLPGEDRTSIESLREHQDRQKEKGVGSAPEQLQIQSDQVNSVPREKVMRSKPKRIDQNSVWRYPESIPKEGLYVDHAGLVLLHPFLPSYFEACGYLDDEKQFKDEAARIAGVQSLAFLITGELALPEFQMTFHKILCGMPLKEPIDLCLDLTDEVKKEANHLLKAALNHWSSLKDTSPDGLRVNFLCRHGKITQKDSGWHLQVKKEPFDMLLNRLPWGIGLVKLPWLGQLVHVDWY